jgi:hypothetical protein
MLRAGLGQQANFPEEPPATSRDQRGIISESRSGVKRQPPKGAASTQQRSGKTQRLRIGVGEQPTSQSRAGGEPWS